MSATLLTAADSQDLSSASKVLPFETSPTPFRLSDAGKRATTAPSRSWPLLAPREHAYRICASLLVGDFLAACVAIFAGLLLREWQRVGAMFTGEPSMMFPPQMIGWTLAGGGLFTWLMISFKTYEVANIYRMQHWLRNLVQSTVLWSMAIWACIGLFQITSYAPRVGVVYCAVALGLLLTLWRLVAFVVLVQPRLKEAASARTIVVGWNQKAAHLRMSMRRDLGQLREIIGCVPTPGGNFVIKPPTELAVLGDFSALPSLVKDCGANSIILADVSCSARQIQDLIAFCQREMIAFQMIPEYFPALNSGLQVQVVSGVPLLGVGRLPLDRTVNRLMKRAIDVVGGMIGAAMSAPIIVFFGILVALESPGPVIYRQRRTSRGGREFFIYKIRSMRMNAEANTGAVWCKREDPRRLKIGAFMRKWNIDELPQFWNVLKGDMSLVGPRPERPELIEKFKDEIPNYNARHEIRSGLTGWAQIQGLRGDTDLRKRIEADLHYLENWSVVMDLSCIFATVFNNKNAH